MKKRTVPIIAVILLVSVPIVAFFATQTSSYGSPPILAASAYTLIDMSSGKALYEHDSDRSLKIGSLTKLMPIYICFQELEKGAISLDDVVTISLNASSRVGSLAHLPEGAQITVDSLLYCVFLPSGNDAITALAEFLCGSEDAMVALMNEIAEELGMENTAYSDCTGIDSFHNRSTAHDLEILSMALITSYLEIRDYTSSDEKIITYIQDGNEHTLTLRNTNKLLNSVDGVYGLKTGTVRGGYSAIVLIEDAGKHLMAIVLDAPDDIARWSSVKALIASGLR